MQSFRNGSKVKEIFRQLGYTLDVFSTNREKSDDVYIYHQALTQTQLYETVASSKFLVAFDNSEPYANYLPSKAFLYVSFTKPIIIFGNNKDSALIRFLKDYPYSYYHNIDSGSIDELKKYINATSVDLFDEKTYSLHTKYLPENALSCITSLIHELTGENNKTPSWDTSDII